MFLNNGSEFCEWTDGDGVDGGDQGFEFCEDWRMERVYRSLSIE